MGKTFFSETHLHSGSYLPHSMVLDRSQEATTDSAISLVDQQNTTCLKTELNGNTWLQIVATFPDSPIGRQMEVEIVVNNETDCSTKAWTWFMGSNCSQMGFFECQKSSLVPQGQFNRCIVSCQCPTPCDYLHLKFTPVGYLDQSVDEICEVYLLYDHVKPEPRGKLPWWER